MPKKILVRAIMTRDVKVARVDTSVKEVVATMNKLHLGSIVVQGEKHFKKPSKSMTVRK